MHYRVSRLLFLVFLAVAALTGCAHNQNPVGLDPQFWADTKPVIGVAMTPVPPPRLALTGNQGLIELGINTAVNNTLSTAVAGWGTDDFKALPEDLATRLEAKGFKVKRIPEPIDLSKYKQTSWREGYLDRDLSALKAQLHGRLLASGGIALTIPTTTTATRWRTLTVGPRDHRLYGVAGLPASSSNRPMNNAFPTAAPRAVLSKMHHVGTPSASDASICCARCSSQLSSYAL